VKTDSDGADVTSGGRLFHMLTTEARKARLPTVDGRTVLSDDRRYADMSDPTSYYLLKIFTLYVIVARKNNNTEKRMS